MKINLITNDMDEELKHLALSDWHAFVTLIGPDAIITAKVHVMKKNGKSINQIANKLKITKSQVETRLKRSTIIVFPQVPAS